MIGKNYGFINRITVLFFIIISAGMLLAVAVHFNSKALAGNGDYIQPDGCQKVYLYCEKAKELKIRPFLSENYILYYFIPFPEQKWLWHVPEDTTLFVDGVACKTGDELKINDSSDQHLIAAVKNDAMIDYYNMACLFGGDIPVLSVNLSYTDLNKVTEEEDPVTKVSARMTLFDTDGKTCFDKSCIFGGHGNSTWWWYDKRSFEVKVDNEVSLLGMHKSRKWNIIANAMDPSNLKNKIVYESAKNTDLEYCVDNEYVNYYINGVYNGLYLLTDKPGAEGCVSFTDDLEEENKTVNGTEPETPVIEDQGDKDEIRYYDMQVSPPDISGSYHLEFDQYSGSLWKICNDPWFRTEKSKDEEGREYIVMVKQPGNANKPEVLYIRDHLRNAEKAIYTENGIDPESGHDYKDYIDSYSWAMSYLFMDFFAYQDYSAGSLYFYKKRGDDRFYSGPLWDYDKCMTDNPYDDNLFPWNGKNPMYLWYERMNRFDDFHNTVIDNYCRELSPALEDILKSKIPEWRSMIEASGRMDEIRWDLDTGIGVERGDMIEEWLVKRKELFDAVWIRGEDSPYADNIY